MERKAPAILRHWIAIYSMLLVASLCSVIALASGLGWTGYPPFDRWRPLHSLKDGVSGKERYFGEGGDFGFTLLSKDIAKEHVEQIKKVHLHYLKRR
jgi:hypothetical protein